jgi:hypothetical protein
MLREKSAFHLILVLFLCVLGANVIGETLRLFLHLAAGDSTKK